MLGVGAHPDPIKQGVTPFGGGAHICPGRFAAGVIARSLIEAMVETEIEITPLSGEDPWIGNNAMSKLAQFPVRLERRL